MLTASAGIIHTTRHKGTSTLGQAERPDAEVANCNGSVTLDLMHYFSKYEENCYSKYLL